MTPNIRVLRGNPNISALAGKLCVQRGLVTYCVEGRDNPVPLSALRLPADASFSEQKSDWFNEELPILKTSGYKVSEMDWKDKLYASQSCVYESREISLIPYCQWGNRGENEMRVWLNEK